MEKNQYLAEKVQEHLNSVGYKIHDVSVSLIKQVLDIDGRTYDENNKPSFIPAVSGRSEQLLAFAQWLKGETLSGLMATPEYYVDRYVKSQ